MLLVTGSTSTWITTRFNFAQQHINQHMVGVVGINQGDIQHSVKLRTHTGQGKSYTTSLGRRQMPERTVFMFLLGRSKTCAFDKINNSGWCDGGTFRRIFLWFRYLCL